MILRGLFSIFIILLFANSLNAKGGVDSLLAVKANLKTGVFEDDSTRIKIDISLIQRLHPIKDYDSISNYYQEIEDFILSCKNQYNSTYEVGYFNLQDALSKVYKSEFKNVNHESDECKDLANKAKIILEGYHESNHHTLKNEAYRISSFLSWNEGVRLAKAKRTHEAINELESGILLAQNCECDNEKSSLYIALGVCFKKNSDYDNALNQYFKAVEVDLKNENYFKLTTTYNNIGIVYKNLRDFERSAKYYQKAITVSKKTHNYQSLSNIYSSLGILAKNKKDYDLALKYYDSSFYIADSIGYSIGMISTISEEAHIHYIHKDYHIAIEKLKFAEEKLNSLSDKTASSSIFFGLAQNNIALNQLVKAKPYVDKLMKLAYQFNNTHDKISAHELLSNYYEKKKNYKLALEHKKIHHLLYDSIFNARVQNDLIAKDIQFNYQRKKQADSLENQFKLRAQQKEAKAEIEKRDLKLKSSRIQLIIAGVALLLILILSYIIYKRLRITTKQKGIIEEQKDKLSTKNQEIAESVNYAKKIQNTILPSNQTVERIFRKFFILYLPKDIVSGDFYWAAETQNHYFLAVADCTGHGVPGALVSFVCSKALDKAVNEEGLIQTDEILNRTRDVVIEQFSQNNNALNDGMDISLIRVDKIELHTNENITLQFSGANNPLWIVSANKNDDRFAGFSQKEFVKNSLIEIKGDKQPIGKFIKMQPFKKHELLLKKGEFIYLLTDGYADQFGGKNDNGKKYKSAKLKAFISKINNKDLKEQKSILTHELEEWSRNHEQVDDITIMGIEIG